LSAESIGAHTCVLFIPATCTQFGAAAGGSFAQHAVSDTHASLVGAPEGGAVGAPPIDAVGAHCAAQLWCMQLPAATPDWEQPGAFSFGAHWVIGPPAQMHAVKSGHDAPTDFTGSRQLVVMQLLHASDGDGPPFARHATMSVDEPPVAVVVGDVVSGGDPSVDAVAGAPDGDVGAGVGSDPHAMEELKTKARATEARVSMAEVSSIPTPPRFGSSRRCLAKKERSYYIGLVSKGASTRDAVLGHALALASEVGLEGVTIGTLADRAKMSKSGLFAHFDSKEALQLAVLDEAVRRFVEQVVAPALREKRGEPRLRALLDNWRRWANADFMPGGCVFVASIAELDDRPGPVRDRLASSQRDWLETLATAVRIAVEEGHFRPDVDAAQLAQEFLTLAYGGHLISRLLRDPMTDTRLQTTLERILASVCVRKN
jgi:AcrR family transcriptional regulator